MLGGLAVGAFLVAVHVAAAVETASPLFHTIPRIHRDPPSEAVLGTQGWVVTTEGGEEKAVVISARRTDPPSSERLTLRGNEIAGLEAGGHYRFVIRKIADGAFELIEFQPVPAAAPELVRVQDPAVLARVRSAVRARLGKDFVLDHLPSEPTLENAFGHLCSETSSDIVRGALAEVPGVYGLEMEVREDDVPFRVFVFSTRPDFRGEIVYAVSAGEEWAVYVSRP